MVACANNYAPIGRFKPPYLSTWRCHFRRSDNFCAAARHYTITGADQPYRFLGTVAHRNERISNHAPVMLRPAKPIRFRRREKFKPRPVVKCQLAERAIPCRQTTFGQEREQPAFALDHRVTRIGVSRRDQSNAASRIRRAVPPCVFHREARFAETATRENKPIGPIRAFRRRNLFTPRCRQPIRPTLDYSPLQIGQRLPACRQVRRKRHPVRP